jgi:two-component system LytT family response regulator
MLRIIIIDDEPLGLNTLKVMIERLEMDVLIVATASDPEKGIALIESYRPDLVFLDVKMPKMNGFELLEKLSCRDFKLVFTTAHKEYAIQAIKFEAYDYLLKPIDSNELQSCITKAAKELSAKNSDQRGRSLLELQLNDGVVLLKQNNIVRLEASGSYTYIHLKDGIKHTASKNLKHFESLLDPINFFRCHQSHIVNLNEVTKIISNDGYLALMSDQSKADIGKNYKEAMMQKLKKI